MTQSPPTVAAGGQVAAAALKLDSEVERPLWVAIGLWGLKTRLMAWAFVVLSVVVATAWIMYLGWNGVVVYGATVWYLMAIHWVEKNGRW